MRAKRKLDSRAVIRIRQMRREGFRRKYIAHIFKISLHSLHCILSHATYKNVR